MSTPFIQKSKFTITGKSFSYQALKWTSVIYNYAFRPAGLCCPHLSVHAYQNVTCWWHHQYLLFSIFDPLLWEVYMTDITHKPEKNKWLSESLLLLSATLAAAIWKYLGFRNKWIEMKMAFQQSHFFCFYMNKHRAAVEEEMFCTLYTGKSIWVAFVSYSSWLSELAPRGLFVFCYFHSLAH